MKLKRLIFLGWKQLDREIELSGSRDLIVADNRGGKTGAVLGVSFLADGTVPGFKKQERLGLLSRNEAKVTGVFERDDGTDFMFTRTLRWKPAKDGDGGSLVEGFEIHPKGTEKSLSDAAERLALECGNRPLKLFDLSGFMDATEEKRLEMLMDFAPSRMVDGENKVEVERPKVQGVAEEVITAARDNILGVPFNGSIVNALTFYGEIAKERAKEVRAEVKRKAGAVAELGSLGVSDMREAEAFLATFDSDIAEARQALENFKAARTSLAERRGEIANLKREIEVRVQREVAALQVIESHDDTVAACANGLLEAEQTLGALQENLEAVEAAANEDEARIRVEIADKEAIFAETDASIKQMRDGLACVEKRVEDGGERDLKLRVEGDAARTSLAATMDAIAAGECHVCGKPKSGDDDPIYTYAKTLTNRIGEMEKARASNFAEWEKQKDLRDQIEEEIQAATDHRQRIVTGIEDLRREREALDEKVRKAKEAVEKAKEAVTTAQSLLQDNQDAGRISVNAMEQAREDKARLEARLAEVSDNLPAEFQEGAIEGGKLRIQELEQGRDNAVDVQRRFRDQEKLRATLSADEARLSAFEAWQRAFQAALRAELREMAAPVLGAADGLISQVWPGESLRLSWETPRGKPGLSIGLWSKAAGERPWVALSGAEKGVLGLALAICLSAGHGKQPLLLTAECEAMSDHTQERFLTAAHEIAGETQLLFTTHHQMTGREVGNWQEHVWGNYGLSE